LLLIGDDFNDFITPPVHEGSVEARFAAVDAYERYWGERWFMLPNPTYGSWEGAVGRSLGSKWKAMRQ
jgi:acid phosphatase